MQRKVEDLLKKANDTSRVLHVIKQEDILNLSSLLTVHLRRECGVKSFINKCIMAAEDKNGWG